MNPVRLSSLGVPMSTDFSDFAKAFEDFKNFFTRKHIAVLLLVAAVLVLILAPNRQDNPAVDGEKAACSDASCPLPVTLTVDPVVITEVGQENWQFDLPGEGWESLEPSNLVEKVIRRNTAQECMIILIKEPTDISFGQYIIESMRGFREGGATIIGLKQVVLNEQKFVLMEASLGSDVLMAWSSLKDGFGYTLCCFYSPNADTGSAQHDLCTEIAESLEIK